MNKELFIKELSTRSKYDITKATLVNEVLENHFIVGKRNKEKIINDLILKLNIDSNEANMIYELSMEILGSELKDRVFHPFISKD